MPRLPRRIVQAGEHRIAYTLAGAGPAVLLLHGLGGTADFWQPLIEPLARRFTVVCPDLLGFGFSSKPWVAYTPARHAAALEAVLADLGLARFRGIIGHSCGGVIGLTLLAQRRLAAERLVLAAVPYPSPRFPVRRELLQSPFNRLMLLWPPLAYTVHHAWAWSWPVLRHLPVAPELRGAWVGYLDHTIPSYVSTAEECLFRADLDPVVAALPAVPTLLLYSRADRSVPLVHGERLAAALPLSELRIGTGSHLAIVRGGQEAIMPWLWPL